MQIPFAAVLISHNWNPGPASDYKITLYILVSILNPSKWFFAFDFTKKKQPANKRVTRFADCLVVNYGFIDIFNWL